MDINDLQGLWRRDWIRSPTVSDSSTRVFWAQSGNRFVDIRIPLNRPNIETFSNLKELDTSVLLELMKAEGFAGKITMDNYQCTWSREMNWHGRSNDIDCGKLWFERENTVLIEDGVHLEYQERWTKVPKQEFQSRYFSVGDMRGLLLWTESLFIFGIGKSLVPSLEGQVEKFKNNITSIDLYEHFNSEYCIGHWQGELGISDLNTNPFRENQTLLKKQDNEIFWIQKTTDGHEKLLPI